MSRKPASKRTRSKPKTVLRLPDLDQAKSAVLNSLTSADAQRGYRHAIDEFVEMVLLGAKALVQPNCRAPLPNSPRISRTGSEPSELTHG